MGADFAGIGILQGIEICDRELCVCGGHPENVIVYGGWYAFCHTKRKGAEAAAGIYYICTGT